MPNHTVEQEEFLRKIIESDAKMIRESRELEAEIAKQLEEDPENETLQYLLDITRETREKVEVSTGKAKDTLARIDQANQAS